MRCLIIGAGFIGQALGRQLSKSGYEVVFTEHEILDVLDPSCVVDFMREHKDWEGTFDLIVYSVGDNSYNGGYRCELQQKSKARKRWVKRQFKLAVEGLDVFMLGLACFITRRGKIVVVSRLSGDKVFGLGVSPWAEIIKAQESKIADLNTLFKRACDQTASMVDGMMSATIALLPCLEDSPYFQGCRRSLAEDLGEDIAPSEMIVSLLAKRLSQEGPLPPRLAIM